MLNELMDKKGALSRQIGEAKRAGQSIDSLLEEMKQVSSRIKSLQAEEKERAKTQSSKGESSGSENDLPEVKSPQLFESSIASNSVDAAEINVSKVQGGEHQANWDAYVASKGNASIYHHWCFKDIIESAFGHQTVYLMATDTDGKTCGVLPAVELNSKLFGHFIVSLPFFTYGAMLAESEAVESKLAEVLCQYAEENGIEHVELRATRPLGALQGRLPEKTHKVSMVRELPDSSEQLWSDIGTKVRAQIKKAQRFELEVKFGKVELLNDFYAVFSENMRDLGTPVYSKRLFKEILVSTLEGQIDIGVVYHQSKPVSCCFLMRHQGMMEIPWASALNSVNHMNVNMFMYWHILQKAVSDGCEFFDFGRSSKDASTYRFKKQWGAEPRQLYWYYWLPEGNELPELNPDNPKYKLMISVWQKLPVWLTQLIGPPVVKHLP